MNKQLGRDVSSEATLQSIVSFISFTRCTSVNQITKPLLHLAGGINKCERAKCSTNCGALVNLNDSCIVKMFGTCTSCTRPCGATYCKIRKTKSVSESLSLSLNKINVSGTAMYEVSERVD